MKKERMPRAGNKPGQRAVAHMRWAHRYNEANDPVRAAAHLGRAIDYQEFGTGRARNEPPSLAFGGRNFWDPPNDEDWRFQAHNHEDYGLGNLASKEELHKYDDQPWAELPAHIQQNVISKPPSVKARANAELKREYDKFLKKFEANAISDNSSKLTTTNSG
jgi:hypothetical protein